VSAVADAVSRLALGEPQSHHNLTLVPLLGDGVGEPGYRLLDEALAEGCARVTEVSEAGRVPELRFINGGARPVLLRDGEELLGAKQNRILNLTVLAPDHQAIVIPVSCVEAGRWQAQSADFGSAGRAQKDAAGFLAALAQAPSARFPAVGLGEDLRLRAEGLAGGALFAAGWVVHLCAFATAPEEHPTTRPGGSHLARASQRRRGWR
jgi:hypothetical protein